MLNIKYFFNCFLLLFLFGLNIVFGFIFNDINFDITSCEFCLFDKEGKIGIWNRF